MTSSTPANAPLAFDRPVANATSQKMAGKLMIAAGSIIFVATLAFQVLYASGVIESGFDTWLPVLYAYALWAASIIFGQVLVRGERGSRATFVLPAVFFTVALVVFPTIFGFYIAFTSWNLSSDAGRVFNGWDNLRALWNDPFFWNALGNMLYYGLMVLVEYAVAFGLACAAAIDGDPRPRQLVIRRAWSPGPSAPGPARRRRCPQRLPGSARCRPTR